MKKKTVWTWGVIAGSLVLLGLVAFSVWNAQAISGSRMPDIAGGQKAKEAYELVQAWATSTWLEDARMVNCQTSYSSLQEMNEGWTFQMYSPSKQVLAIIILQGKEPRLLREIAALYPQTALPLSDWVMDSQDAMSTWWKNGGSTIWGREDSEGVHLFLGLNTKAQMVWQVTVTQKGSVDLSYWEIAADNAVGQVLERYIGGVQ